MLAASFFTNGDRFITPDLLLNNLMGFWCSPQTCQKEPGLSNVQHSQPLCILIITEVGLGKPYIFSLNKTKTRCSCMGIRFMSDLGSTRLFVITILEVRFSGKCLHHNLTILHVLCGLHSRIWIGPLRYITPKAKNYEFARRNHPIFKRVVNISCPELPGCWRTSSRVSMSTIHPKIRRMAEIISRIYVYIYAYCISCFHVTREIKRAMNYQPFVLHKLWESISPFALAAMPRNVCFTEHWKRNLNQKLKFRLGGKYKSGKMLGSLCLKYCNMILQFRGGGQGRGKAHLFAKFP